MISGLDLSDSRNDYDVLSHFLGHSKGHSKGHIFHFRHEQFMKLYEKVDMDKG